MGFFSAFHFTQGVPKGERCSWKSGWETLASGTLASQKGSQPNPHCCVQLSWVVSGGRKVAPGQESRDSVRDSHSHGTMLGAEEEASRPREECSEGWGCGRTKMSKSSGCLLEHGTRAESGANGMRESDSGSHTTLPPSHRMGFHKEAGASLVNLETKIQTPGI